MPIPSVDLILFAVQAGVRLVQTGRKAYVETAIGGDVELPLPPAFAADALMTAVQYAEALKEKGTTDLQARERFRVCYQEAYSQAYEGTETEKRSAQERLVQQYLTDMAHGLVPFVRPASAGFASITVIHQWAQGSSPFPSPLQRIAGSLVEIAIDYFVQIPGALNEDSRQGKALKSFLQGLSAVDFQDARWDAIAISLFTTALDTLQEHPDLITGEATDQALLQKIVAGVASDVAGRLQAAGPGDLDAETRLKRCGQIVLRSLLRNGGTAILENPSRLVDDKGGAALVQSVGSVFLELLLGDDNVPLQEALQKVASTEGFDRLVRAALKTVIEHPDNFATGNDAVNHWLHGVLSDLYNRRGDGKPFLDPELFVEVAYAVMDNGLRDLPLLLGETGATPAFLVDVARRSFDILTVPPSGDTLPRFKRLHLSRSDLQALFSGILLALTAHNPWLQARPQSQEEAAALVPLIIAVLGDAGEAPLKALIRSDQLAAVIAAVLASEVLKTQKPEDREKIAAGVKALLAAVATGGAAGADRLLDPAILHDILTALARSGAAARLFGGQETQVRAVLDKLLPLLETLRRDQFLSLAELTGRLA